jgi:hypothetical protein
MKIKAHGLLVAVLIGTGVGLFFLQTSALAFLGSILAGLGLVVTAIVSHRSNSDR